MDDCGVSVFFKELYGLIGGLGVEVLQDGSFGSATVGSGVFRGSATVFPGWPVATGSHSFFSPARPSSAGRWIPNFLTFR